MYIDEHPSQVSLKLIELIHSIYKHLESEDSDTEEDYTEQLNYIGRNLCGVRDRLIDLHDDMEKYVEDEDDEDTLFYLAAMWGKYIAVRRFCELDVDDLCFVPFAPLLRTGRWYVSVPNVANTLRAIMDENPDAAIELSNSIFSKD